MIEVLRAIGEDIATEGTSTRRLDADRAGILAALSREEIVDLLEDAAVALREQVALEPLRTRDLAEYELLGAAFILQCTTDDLPSPARLVFDALVKPEVWRLVALNDARRSALERILPAHRKRFWWWSDGAGIPATAIDALSTTAQLIARFPAARARLDALVRADAADHAQLVLHLALELAHQPDLGVLELVGVVPVDVDLGDERDRAAQRPQLRRPLELQADRAMAHRDAPARGLDLRVRRDRDQPVAARGGCGRSR